MAENEVQQVNARLRESDARFRAAFDHAAIGMAVVGLDGRWLQVNQALCRIVGYSEPELLTSDFQSITHPDDLITDLNYVEQLITDKVIDYQMVKRYVHKQGRLVWVLLSVSLVRDEQGNPVYFVSQIQDITRRKEAEEALRSSEEEYRATFDLAGVGKVQVDLQTGRFVRVNRKFCRISGYTEAELQCLTVGQLTHPDDAAQSLEAVRRMRAGEISEYCSEKRFVRKDGAVVWVSVNAAAINDAQGKPTRSVATLEDITERKRAGWLEQDRRQVLEMVARDLPLPLVLTRLVDAIERQMEGFAAVMAIHDAELALHAPTLPEDWQDAIRKKCLELASALSPAAWDSPDRCGVSYIQSTDIWTDLRPLAAQHGFAACWAVVIKSDDSVPLGLLTVFTRQSRGPGSSEAQTLEMAGNLAAICLEHHNTTRQLAHLVRHDTLTGLPNRICFEDRCEQALSLAQREKRHVGLFVMDVDHFKQVNDTLGHDAGDALLQQFAHRIKGQIRASDTLARMGGDEFMLILPDLDQETSAAIVARKLVDCLKEPFQVSGGELRVTSSIGIAVYPHDGEDSPSLQRCADQRMYSVKQSGRNGYADRSAGTRPVAQAG